LNSSPLLRIKNQRFWGEGVKLFLILKPTIASLINNFTLEGAISFAYQIGQFIAELFGGQELKISSTTLKLV
jgi:hypothetical protein